MLAKANSDAIKDIKTCVYELQILPCGLQNRQGPNICLYL